MLKSKIKSHKVWCYVVVQIGFIRKSKILVNS
jgi:hypothetical protein